MMTTYISDSCSKILTCVRSSGLNFYCEETPYSIYITVRKSQSKNIQVTPDHAEQQVQLDHRQVTEFTLVNQELVDAKAELNTLKKIKDELEAKGEAFITETQKKLSRKDDDNKVLKNSIKSCTSENETLKCELKNLQKVIKAKDKEIYNLEKYKYNNQESVKNAKQDAKEQKKEKENYLKQVKLLEKKIEKFQKPKTLVETNNNNSSNSKAFIPAFEPEPAGSPSKTPPGSSRQLSPSEKPPTSPSISQPCIPPPDTSVVPPVSSESVIPVNSDFPQCNSSPTRPTPPPLTCTSSPRTPPGTPPFRWSQSSVGTLVTSAAAITGTYSTSQPQRETDYTSRASSDNISVLPITEDYIVGINNIDLGPRVNDLSKM